MVVRFLVAFLNLSYIGSERRRSSDRKTVSQDCFLGAGVGAGGVLERLFSKHRWLGACFVGKELIGSVLRLSYIDFPPQHDG